MEKQRKRVPNLHDAHHGILTFWAQTREAPHRFRLLGDLKGGRLMLRQTTILLVGAAGIGVGLLGMSSAFAAPASGAVIGDAASAGAVTQKVFWRGRAVGWHGVGWRGVGWRGVGWRTGWGPGWRGVGWRAGWGPGWRRVGWRAGWGPGWRARWGWGWRPGLAAAGVAAAGVATAAGYNNYGYGGYPYGYSSYGNNYGTGYYGTGYYGPGAYTAQNYNYGYGYQPAVGYGYGYQPAAGAAALVSTPTAPAPAAAPANPNYASNNYGNETGYRSYRRHRTAAVGGERWTRAYCINAVHERLGVSSTDAAKDTNRDALMRCMQRGPMSIG
jgi:hypothetical protein